MVNDEGIGTRDPHRVDTRTAGEHATHQLGTAVLLAAAPAGRGRAMDAASVLPALAAVPPGVLTGTVTATVVELADPLDPQTVLTRLRAAAATPGPLALYLAGQLHLDRRQQLPHLALARTTPATLRYTALPWHWLTAELAVRPPGTTTVVADLAADAGVLERLATDHALLRLGPDTPLFGRIVPAPRRGEPVTPDYLRAWADLWRTGARPSVWTLHAEAAARSPMAGSRLLTPPQPPARAPYTPPPPPGGTFVPVGREDDLTNPTVRFAAPGAVRRDGGVPGPGLPAPANGAVPAGPGPVPVPAPTGSGAGTGNGTAVPGEAVPAARSEAPAPPGTGDKGPGNPVGTRPPASGRGEPGTAPLVPAEPESAPADRPVEPVPTSVVPALSDPARPGRPAAGLAGPGASPTGRPAPAGFVSGAPPVPSARPATAVPALPEAARPDQQAASPAAPEASRADRPMAVPPESPTAAAEASLTDRQATVVPVSASVVPALPEAARPEQPGVAAEEPVAVRPVLAAASPAGPEASPSARPATAVPAASPAAPEASPADRPRAVPPLTAASGAAPTDRPMPVPPVPATVEPVSASVVPAATEAARPDQPAASPAGPGAAPADRPVPAGSGPASPPLPGVPAPAEPARSETSPSDRPVAGGEGSDRTGAREVTDGSSAPGHGTEADAASGTVRPAGGVTAGVEDPHPAILAAAMAGRHGEAAAVAAAWESEALRRFGPRSREALHWLEVRADLARLAGEPARSCELWLSVADALLAWGRRPDDPEVEGAVDRAHHQWEQIGDPARARTLGPALLALRQRVPGRKPGALEALRRRMGR